MELVATYVIVKWIGILALILLLVASYKFVLTPYLKLARMRKELKGKYSVYEYPFRPYGVSFIQRFLRDFQQFGDSFKSRKMEYPKKDVTLAALKDRVMVTFINQKLIHDFVQRQKEGFYSKVDGGIHVRSLKNFIGDGLLLSEGEEWRYKRKIMSSLFSFEFVKSKFPMILSISKDVCEEAKLQKGKNGLIQVEVDKLFQTIFGTIVIRCFFGDIELKPIKGKKFFQFLNGLLLKIANRNMRVSSFLCGSFLMKYGLRKIDREISKDILAFREYTKQAIDEIIKNAQKSAESNESEGLVGKLLREKKLVRNCPFQEKIKNGYYTYEDLINEMSTFFFAGTDTTSNSNSFLMHRIIERKDVEEKIRREIKDVLNDDVRNITTENIKKMNYLRYCLEENLRMLTPVPNLIMREALYDHKIGDIKILKGDIVNVQILANHYREDVFEQPLEFIPERWEKLEKQPDISKNYFPFSVGSRICIGQQLALIEAKVALIVFMLSFKNGKAVQPLRCGYLITYGPTNCSMKFEVK